MRVLKKKLKRERKETNVLKSHFKFSNGSKIYDDTLPIFGYKPPKKIEITPIVT